jgi:hypothetical protein
MYIPRSRLVAEESIKERRRVRIWMTYAVFAHSFNQPRLSQVHRPLPHYVLTWIVDDAWLSSASLSGVRVSPFFAADRGEYTSFECAILVMHDHHPIISVLQSQPHQNAPSKHQSALQSIDFG